jgi:hypothetical protein
MREALLFTGIIGAFAVLCTVHVAIVWSLLRQHPRWHALVAFFVPPLAPYWALRTGMVVRGGIWIGSVILYTTLLGIATV